MNLCPFSWIPTNWGCVANIALRVFIKKGLCYPCCIQKCFKMFSALKIIKNTSVIVQVCFFQLHRHPPCGPKKAGDHRRILNFSVWWYQNVYAQGKRIKRQVINLAFFEGKPGDFGLFTILECRVNSNYVVCSLACLFLSYFISNFESPSVIKTSPFVFCWCRSKKWHGSRSSTLLFLAKSIEYHYQ